MTLTGVLVTHYHPDHVGGDLGGWSIAGVRELLALPGMRAKLHVQADEAHGHQARHRLLRQRPRAARRRATCVEVGDVKITLMHTPGHTPGSQCFYVDGRLVSGDTLFLDGCGRTDLPGGDPEALYESLQKLAAVPDDTVLYPGHMYSPEPYAPMGDVRRTNYVFRPRTREQWMMMFG